jgi:hypothetical protein
VKYFPYVNSFCTCGPFHAWRSLVSVRFDPQLIHKSLSTWIYWFKDGCLRIIDYIYIYIYIYIYCNCDIRHDFCSNSEFGGS